MSEKKVAVLFGACRMETNMNEKAQALVAALRGVGISVSSYEFADGDFQIDIDRIISSGENNHFDWSLGDNNGFAFLIKKDGQIKAVSE